MKKILLYSLIFLIGANIVCAQKKSTIIGDACTGEVTATNDTTREITISYDNKGKTESFVGVLNEGFQVKMIGGSFHELKVSEIPVGTCIRVLYRTKEEKVGGQKVKVNRIFGIELIPRDKYVQLREALKLPATTPVTLAESNPLPAGNPLKLYLVIDDQNVQRSFSAWVEEWNKDQGKKYGMIALAPDLAQADAVLVRHPGSVSVLNFRTAVNYLVVRKPAGLEVLWTIPVLVDGGAILSGQPPLDEKEKVEAASRRLEKALEQAMKHRNGKQQK
jgi:hypothetical protein